jgi:uridine kinase
LPHQFLASSLLFACRQVDPADVIILEGILVLHMQELRAHCNMLVYVDTGEGQ